VAGESPAQGEPAGLPRDGGGPALRRPVVRADVDDLLRRYRAALELAADAPPSRHTRSAPLTRTLCRIRPTWGLQRLVVEHIRARIALLDRRYCLRLALGEQDPNDEQDRAALALFGASLPPARSKLWVVAPVLALITVSQVLLALLMRGKDNDGTLLPGKIINQLSTITADVNPGNFTETLDTLMHTNPKVTALAIGLLILSTYIVWRPMLPAFAVKRMIFAMPGSIKGKAAPSELGRRAEELGVHRAEVELFAALGMRPPSDRAMDLWVKGAIVAILLALAVLALLPPALPLMATLLLGIAAVRTAWIARRWRERTLRRDLVTPHVRPDGAVRSSE
jgi:hypothetical protein